MAVIVPKVFSDTDALLICIGMVDAVFGTVLTVALSESGSVVAGGLGRGSISVSGIQLIACQRLV